MVPAGDGVWACRVRCGSVVLRGRARREDILGRAGDTPPSCALPLALVHAVSLTRLPRALTVWLTLVAQRQTLHLHKGPATPLCVTQHACATSYPNAQHNRVNAHTG